MIWRCFKLFCAVMAVSAASGVVATEAPMLVEDARFAYTNISIIDGTGREARHNQTVIVENGLFTYVGDAQHAPITPDQTTFDGHGKTLIPGLVMMHEHMFYPVGRRNYTEMLYSFPRLYLAGGVTTVRTAGTMAPYADLNLRDEIDKDRVLGPDIDVTAPYLNGPGLPILKVKALTGVADARKTLQYWADEGVTSYKAYMHIRRDELKEIVTLAHQRQQKVTAHLCSVTFAEAAKLGIDNLEHGFFAATDFVSDKQPDQCPDRQQTLNSLLELDIESDEVNKLIALLVEKQVALTSTLTVFETFAKGRPKAPDAALDMLTPQVRQQYESTWQRIADSEDDNWSRIFVKARALEHKFVKAGGTLLVGTDPTGYGGVIAGYANKRVIELLVEAGFSIEQVIRFSSLNGARYLGRDRLIGSIETGKRADFAVVDGNLTTDPSMINQMPIVFKKGIGYDARAIIKSAKGTVGQY